MTPKSLTFDDCVIILSPTLTDKPLRSHFSCGDLNTINSVFESLIFNLLVIIHLLISARQLFNFEIASNGCLHLNETYKFRQFAQRPRFQRLPPARGGTGQRKIFNLANRSQLIHPGPSSSRSSFFMESSQLYAATLTHYSTEPLTTGLH